MKGDSTSIVAFSDRAELIVSPDQAKDMAVARARLSQLQAGGGTEIAQGLRMGLGEIQRNFSRDGINHLILLIRWPDLWRRKRVHSDGGRLGRPGNHHSWRRDRQRLERPSSGRYGQQEPEAAYAFLDSPDAIMGVMEDIYDKLGRTVASRLRLEGSVAQQVDMRSAFRLLPEPMPMGDSLPMTLGNLAQGRDRACSARNGYTPHREDFGTHPGSLHNRWGYTRKRR